jgi:hypothetical protein
MNLFVGFRCILSGDDTDNFNMVAQLIECTKEEQQFAA